MTYPTSHKVLYDAKYETPPSRDRLHAMIKAVDSGVPLDDAMRAEIIDALKRVEVRAANDAVRKTRGRSLSIGTFMCAALAKKLIDDHGIKRELAAKVAVDSFRAKMGIHGKGLTYDAVARAYRKIKADGSMTLPSGDKVVPALLSDPLIVDAMSRVSNTAKSGNK